MVVVYRKKIDKKEEEEIPGRLMVMGDPVPSCVREFTAITSLLPFFFLSRNGIIKKIRAAAPTTVVAAAAAQPASCDVTLLNGKRKKTSEKFYRNRREIPCGT